MCKLNRDYYLSHRDPELEAECSGFRVDSGRWGWCDWFLYVRAREKEVLGSMNQAEAELKVLTISCISSSAFAHQLPQ